jgi:hypothetical protein
MKRKLILVLLSLSIVLVLAGLADARAGYRGRYIGRHPGYTGLGYRGYVGGYRRWGFGAAAVLGGAIALAPYGYHGVYGIYPHSSYGYYPGYGYSPYGYYPGYNPPFWSPEWLPYW